MFAFAALGLLRGRLGKATYLLLGCLIAAYVAYAYK